MEHGENSTYPIEILLADLENGDHAEAVLGLLEAFALEPMSGGEGLSPRVRDAIIPGLRSQSSSRIFLARLDGLFVGTAICFFGFSTFRAQPLINIHDLVVLREFRGKRIGRSLISAISDHARTSGCCKLTLEVREDNGGALRLYRDQGFRNGSDEDPPVRYLFLQKRL